MKDKSIIFVWGCFDLCSIGWYLTSSLLHGQLPLYHDIVKSVKTSASFGVPSLVILTVFSLLLYVSLAFSGVYLIQQKRRGAILSYIQTPFRVLAIMPPSIFFAVWPFKYIFSNPRAISSVVVYFGIILISEALKTFSIVMWQRRCLSHNNGVLSDAANDAAPHTP